MHAAAGNMYNKIYQADLQTLRIFGPFGCIISHMWQVKRQKTLEMWQTGR